MKILLLMAALRLFYYLVLGMAFNNCFKGLIRKDACAAALHATIVVAIVWQIWGLE